MQLWGGLNAVQSWLFCVVPLIHRIDRDQQLVVFLKKLNGITITSTFCSALHVFKRLKRRFEKLNHLIKQRFNSNTHTHFVINLYTKIQKQTIQPTTELKTMICCQMHAENKSRSNRNATLQLRTVLIMETEVRITENF